MFTIWNKRAMHVVIFHHASFRLLKLRNTKNRTRILLALNHTIKGNFTCIHTSEAFSFYGPIFQTIERFLRLCIMSSFWGKTGLRCLIKSEFLMDKNLYLKTRNHCKKISEYGHFQFGIWKGEANRGITYFAQPFLEKLKELSTEFYILLYSLGICSVLMARNFNNFLGLHSVYSL